VGGASKQLMGQRQRAASRASWEGERGYLSNL
jgi:hypothetical protein